MIDKIDNSSIQDFFEKIPPKQPESGSAAASGDADASLQVDYASLVEKAMQNPQEDPDVVRQAKELLALGQLESPENAEAAAENIITFGA